MKSHYFSLLREIIENSSGISELGKLSNHQLRWFLKLASSNRVLFILCKKVKQLGYGKLGIKTHEIIEEIIKKGEEINKNYSAILKKVKAEFAENNIPFLIVKTDRKIEYILSDVDIVVKAEDFDKAQRLLAGIALDRSVNKKKKRWHYKFGRNIQIDIHSVGTDWYSDDFINEDSIWEGAQERHYLGDTYLFPSQQNEWIFNALNVSYERFSLTYLDIIFFRSCNNINLTQIHRIAERRKWDVGLRILREYIDRIEKQSVGTGLTLPLMFSCSDFLKIFINRFFSGYKSHRISLYFFLYFIYCKARFVITRKSRISFYGNWFNFNKEAIKNLVT